MRQLIGTADNSQALQKTIPKFLHQRDASLRANFRNLCSIVFHEKLRQQKRLDRIYRIDKDNVRQLIGTADNSQALQKTIPKFLHQRDASLRANFRNLCSIVFHEKLRQQKRLDRIYRIDKIMCDSLLGTADNSQALQKTIPKFLHQRDAS